MLADIGRFGDGGAAHRALLGASASSAWPARSSCSPPPPAVPSAGATPARSTIPDEAKVRALLRDFGDHDSLGYFATRRDKSVVWDTGDAATARAGVSYRVIGSVSLASGNPVGDPRALGRGDRALARAGPRATAGRSP